MKQTSGERIVKDIKRKTRKQYSTEEKIRIVLEGLRGEESVADLCRQEGIAQGLYYKWSKRCHGRQLRSKCREWTSWRQARNGLPVISPGKPTRLAAVYLAHQHLK